mgnify:CR=1 FL=1
MNKQKEIFEYLNPPKYSSFNLLDLWLTHLNNVRKKEIAGEISTEEYIEVIKERSNIFLPNKKFMVDKYGKQDFCFNDPCVAMRHYVWTFDLKNGKLWVAYSSDGLTLFVDKNLCSTEEDLLVDFQNGIREIFDIKTF